MLVAVKGAWVLENVRRLGSGAFYHLAYAHRQVDTALLQQLKHKGPAEGRITLYWIAREGIALRFATGELLAIHSFPEFIRLHFMIVSVFEGEAISEMPWDGEYLVIPAPKHA